MKFIFIDEIECSQKNPNFYGLGAVVFNYYSYHKYKEAFKNEFEKLNWNPEIEFKGKFLFSRGGDNEITIEKRLDFVEAITRETSSKSNSRAKFIFCHNNEGNSEENYLRILWNIVDSIKPSGMGYKNLLFYFFDKNEGINKKKIIELVNDYSKGTVFERPFFIDSDNNMPGIITVDILNYLKSWIAINPSGEGQLNLFNELKGYDIEKYKKVREILSNVSRIKNLKCK